MLGSTIKIRKPKRWFRFWDKLLGFGFCCWRWANRTFGCPQTGPERPAQNKVWLERRTHTRTMSWKIPNFQSNDVKRQLIIGLQSKLKRLIRPTFYAFYPNFIWTGARVFEPSWFKRILGLSIPEMMTTITDFVRLELLLKGDAQNCSLFSFLQFVEGLFSIRIEIWATFSLKKRNAQSSSKTTAGMRLVMGGELFPHELREMHGHGGFKLGRE